jgi:EAL domain-containing protein (putative c-di-GMP-specific phosphodiesterase class I)
MLESIIDLAHKLGLEVIAEGVEYEEQFNEIIKLKCDMIQGFYFAQPLSVVNFFAYYKDKKRK